MVRRYMADPGLREELTAEGEQVVREAKAEMSGWIDRSLDSIKETITSAIDDSEKTISEEVQAIEKELADLDSSLNKILESIEATTVEFPEAKVNVKKTKELIETVRGDLKRREERWKAVGELAVKAVKKAGMLALGV